MKQHPPKFKKIISTKNIADILNITKNSLDSRCQIQEVSTDLPFLIVPLKGLNEVKNMANINWELFKKYSSALALLVFSPETYKKENDLNVRVFIPYPTIPEDPATGSANGCLAAYLVEHKYFQKDAIDIRVEQGYEIGRLSLLYLKAKRHKDAIDVQVGGKVIMIAKGELC